MRRWIVLALLALLPLQLSLAAVARCCTQEASAAAADHPGHHEHAEQDSSPTGSGVQCPFCDVGCAHFLCAELDTTRGDHAPRDLFEVPLVLASRAAEGPERPDWLPHR